MFCSIKGPVISTVMYFTFFEIHTVKANTALYEFTLLVVYLLPFHCHELKKIIDDYGKIFEPKSHKTSFKVDVYDQYINSIFRSCLCYDPSMFR